MCQCVAANAVLRTTTKIADQAGREGDVVPPANALVTAKG